MVQKDINQSFYNAANSGNVLEMEKLFNLGADVNAKCKPEEYGRRPLHTTALNNRIEAMKWLIEKGADVDLTDSRTQETPLHIASRYNNLQAAKILIESDAKINLVDAAGYTSCRRAPTEEMRELLCGYEAL